jgi:hypothetical protein
MHQCMAPLHATHVCLWWPRMMFKVRDCSSEDANLRLKGPVQKSAVNAACACRSSCSFVGGSNQSVDHMVVRCTRRNCRPGLSLGDDVGSLIWLFNTGSRVRTLRKFVIVPCASCKLGTELKLQLNTGQRKTCLRLRTGGRLEHHVTMSSRKTKTKICVPDRQLVASVRPGLVTGPS